MVLCPQQEFWITWFVTWATIIWKPLIIQAVLYYVNLICYFLIMVEKPVSANVPNVQSTEVGDTASPMQDDEVQEPEYIRLWEKTKN